jgi:dienelactone hydrolase
LRDAGIAALVVDSYRSRNLRHSLRDQSLLGSWEISNDAIAALRWLAAQDMIRTGRIAVMGVSKGATAAIHTSLQVRRRWMRADDVAFAAHIALSPACTWINRSHANTGAPMLFLLAGLDIETPAAPCIAYADRLRQAGADTAVKVYENTHHGWERLGAQPIDAPREENYAKCRVWVEDDGSMTAADTGEKIPESSWHEWAVKTCMTYGTRRCGGTPEQKERARNDILAFLHRHGFLAGTGPGAAVR